MLLAESRKETLLFFDAIAFRRNELVVLRAMGSFRLITVNIKMALHSFNSAPVTVQIYQTSPPHVVRLPSCSALPQPQPLTGARQIRRFSACHSECAIPAIGLALYVASDLLFSSDRFSLSRLNSSEDDLAPHQVVVARAPYAHTHALLLVSHEQK